MYMYMSRGSSELGTGEADFSPNPLRKKKCTKLLEYAQEGV